MGDIRKPMYVLLLRILGKKTRLKVELFRADLWPEERGALPSRFRIRLNGKWWPKGEMAFFTKTKVKELFFRGLH